MSIKKSFNKTTIIVIGLILFTILFSGCIGSDSPPTNDNFSGNISDSSPYDSNNSTGDNSQNSTKPAHYEESGYCDYVVDGDTINVIGVGRVRFVGVNTPEKGQPGYQEAKDFVKSYCLGKTVYLDVDDAKNHDKYGRTLAIVYVGKTNLNAILLKKGYAEVMYIPPSEFPKGLNT